MYRYDSGRSGFAPDRGPTHGHDLRWFLPLGGGVTTTPAYWDGMLFVGTGGGQLLCAAASDGEEFWSTGLGGELRSTPAVADDVLVVGVHDGALSAGRGFLAGLNVWSGEELWGVHDHGVTMSPLIVDGVAYVGSSEGAFFGVEVSSGTQRWAAQAGASNGTPSLATADGVMVVVTSSGLVHGFSLSSGDQLWAFHSEFKNETTPAISAGRVVFTTFLGQLICLDLQSGRTLWSTPTNTNATSPAVHGGRVIVNRGPKGHVAAYSLVTGQLLWDSAVEGDPFSSPTVTRDHVYTKGNNVLVALHVDTGETAWSQPFTELLATSLTIAGDDLYIGSHWHSGGGLHAFGPPSSFDFDDVPF